MQLWLQVLRPVSLSVLVNEKEKTLLACYCACHTHRSNCWTTLLQGTHKTATAKNRTVSLCHFTKHVNSLLGPTTGTLERPSHHHPQRALCAAEMNRAKCHLRKHTAAPSTGR